MASDHASACPDPGLHRPSRNDRVHLLFAYHALCFAEGYTAALDDTGNGYGNTLSEIVGEAALTLSLHLQQILDAMAVTPDG